MKKLKGIIRDSLEGDHQSNQMPYYGGGGGGGGHLQGGESSDLPPAYSETDPAGGAPPQADPGERGLGFGLGGAMHGGGGGGLGFGGRGGPGFGGRGGPGFGGRGGPGLGGRGFGGRGGPGFGGHGFGGRGGPGFGGHHQHPRLGQYQQAGQQMGLGMGMGQMMGGRGAGGMWMDQGAGAMAGQRIGQSQSKHYWHQQQDRYLAGLPAVGIGDPRVDDGAALTGKAARRAAKRKARWDRKAAKRGLVPRGQALQGWTPTWQGQGPHAIPPYGGQGGPMYGPEEGYGGYGGYGGPQGGGNYLAPGYGRGQTRSRSVDSSDESSSDSERSIRSAKH